MNAKPDFIIFLEERYDQAKTRKPRRWFNEGKLLILWYWLLLWVRRLQDGDDCSYEAFRGTGNKSLRWGQLVDLAGGVTSAQRLVKYSYLRRVRHGLYKITVKGKRCAYEMAIRVLKEQEREIPNDLWLQDFANWYEIYDLDIAWQVGCEKPSMKQESQD